MKDFSKPAGRLTKTSLPQKTFTDSRFSGRLSDISNCAPRLQMICRCVYFVYLVFIESITMVPQDPLVQSRCIKEQPYARANQNLQNKLLVADSQTDYTGVQFRRQRRLSITSRCSGNKPALLPRRHVQVGALEQLFSPGSGDLNKNFPKFQMPRGVVEALI